MRSVILRAALMAALLLGALPAEPARAASAAAIDARVDRAIEELLRTTPGAPELLRSARAVLVFPKVVKGGLLVGGAYGEGALRIGGRTVGYYSLAEASVGLQLGVQSAKQALFFMTQDSLERFQRADGWTVGVEAEVTAPGDGLSASLTSLDNNAPVVAVTFGEDGLLAGASLAGAKVSPITR